MKSNQFKLHLLIENKQMFVINNHHIKIKASPKLNLSGGRASLIYKGEFVRTAGYKIKITPSDNEYTCNISVENLFEIDANKKDKIYEILLCLAKGSGFVDYSSLDLHEKPPRPDYDVHLSYNLFHNDVSIRYGDNASVVLLIEKLTDGKINPWFNKSVSFTHNKYYFYDDGWGSERVRHAFLVRRYLLFGILLSEYKITEAYMEDATGNKYELWNLYTCCQREWTNGKMTWDKAVGNK